MNATGITGKSRGPGRVLCVAAAIVAAGCGAGVRPGSTAPVTPAPAAGLTQAGYAPVAYGLYSQPHMRTVELYGLTPELLRAREPGVDLTGMVDGMRRGMTSDGSQGVFDGMEIQVIVFDTAAHAQAFLGVEQARRVVTTDGVDGPYSVELADTHSAEVALAWRETDTQQHLEGWFLLARDGAVVVELMAVGHGDFRQVVAEQLQRLTDS